ncbi:putative RNA-directed DNA polymerase from transposon BS [Varanus komodoensis]|nr:putative RNA-directed DNA polymerase from transposon BS [Varanus komodoensis]
MDPEGFLKALGEFPADKTGAPVEALVELWNGEMTRAVDTIAPKRPLPPGRARSSPWYTPELRAMKQVGRRLERRWRKSRDESDRTHLRAHYRAYAVAVRAAKKRFFSASIASSQCRPAELFRVVQGLVRPGPKEDLIPPSKTRCDDFVRHFREKIAQIRHELDTTIDSEVSKETPMLPSGPDLLDEFQLLRPDDVDKVLGRVRPTTCLLDPCPSWLINDSKHGIGTWILEVVNASLREGRVPAPLKEAVVRPVLKKASLDPEMATNYRPVANIPFLGKVLERVVAGQLQALLDETDYLDPLQSGFRPGYGTESALVALYDDLCREKDRGSASLLVLLDLSAAFDTIDHGILLDRLAGLGVGGTALQWFRSYLNGRFQKVVLGDYGSAPWQLCHGVPQGSILSPLLFNIYMKPLGEVIRRCGLRNHQYADDTQLYLSFSTNPGEAVAVLNRCLAEVMGWMRANKLKLNPDKTEVLLVGGSGFGEGELNLVLNGVALPLRDKVRSLGVLLDPELSLEAQVTAVARSAFLQLRLIHQLRPYLENDCLATVTHALVTSRLDFCNALYVGLPLTTVRILQLVQNRAARLLTGTGRYVHMTPVLRQLHWLPIEVRAQFKVLVMTYKALNGLGPGYLKERLHPYMPSRPLRSAGEALLREPSMEEVRRRRASIFHDLVITEAFKIYSLVCDTMLGAGLSIKHHLQRTRNCLLRLAERTGVVFAIIIMEEMHGKQSSLVDHVSGKRNVTPAATLMDRDWPLNDAEESNSPNLFRKEILEFGGYDCEAPNSVLTKDDTENLAGFLLSLPLDCQEQSSKVCGGFPPPVRRLARTEHLLLDLGTKNETVEACLTSTAVSALSADMMVIPKMKEQEFAKGPGIQLGDEVQEISSRVEAEVNQTDPGNGIRTQSGLYPPPPPASYLTLSPQQKFCELLKNENPIPHPKDDNPNSASEMNEKNIRTTGLEAYLVRSFVQAGANQIPVQSPLAGHDSQCVRLGGNGVSDREKAGGEEKEKKKEVCQKDKEECQKERRKGS